MQRSSSSRKLIIGGFLVAIVALSLFALATVLIPLLQNPGVRTGQLDASQAKPASTSVDGTWALVRGYAPNQSSVGYTFPEVLPSDRRITSGSTQGVGGSAEIIDGKVVSGEIEVDMTTIATDIEKRDINVRSKIFEVDTYPRARFELIGPVDVSHLPEDGTTANVTIPGTLTIKDVSREISAEFTAVRSGDLISMSATIPINRLDYNVETPEFVAAVIEETGELNVLLTFQKQEG